jgi:AcrR family transcriptional regulator
MNAQSNVRRTREQQRAHYRTMLVEGMRRLLDRKAYAEITVDDILTESGVARATYYANFKTKSELLLEVGGDLYRNALTVATPWWQLQSGASRRDLMDALGGIFDLYLPNKSTMAGLMEASAYEGEVQGQVRLLQQGSVLRLERHIRDGQRRGIVRDSLYPKETAGWLIWMVERGLYQMATSANSRQQRRLLESLTDVVWYTLYDVHD